MSWKLSTGPVGGGRRPRVGQAGPNGRITRTGNEKFQEKEKKINGPPGNFGPDLFCAALRKRKDFRILIQGVIFKFKF
jgi:hypothetical protein